MTAITTTYRDERTIAGCRVVVTQDPSVLTDEILTTLLVFRGHILVLCTTTHDALTFTTNARKRAWRTGTDTATAIARIIRQGITA